VIEEETLSSMGAFRRPIRFWNNHQISQFGPLYRQPFGPCLGRAETSSEIRMNDMSVATDSVHENEMSRNRMSTPTCTDTLVIPNQLSSSWVARPQIEPLQKKRPLQSLDDSPKQREPTQSPSVFYKMKVESNQNQIQLTLETDVST
jgi:hypothetical protein